MSVKPSNDHRLRRDATADLEHAKHELAQIDRKIAKLVAAISDGGPAKALTAEVQKLEARQEELTAMLASADAPVPPLIHPAMPELYRQKVASLQASLNDPAYRDEAAEIIRSLVEAILLTPEAGKLHLELHGELAGILALCAGARQQKAPAGISAGAIASQVKLVAGTGFEPVTFRL